MAKLNLNEIIQGSLVNSTHPKTIEFKHNGKTETVDIVLKQLPYAITEPLFTRLNKGEDVVAEWIAAALVDDDGKTYLTKKQVAANFTQTLASAVFNAILGIEKAPKDEEGKSD
ncbi:hypothetical protein BVG18_00315 [Acinetobacter lwoffii]|uniref:phage tail assembly chaperone family protein, TAC n=1 Tax=Acinetobacter lwoffii TaxID=28090 RepID=UPI000A329A7C|nr:hypothetical protein BVG18_00315 [Acinetobacter lwoffii]